MTTRLVAAFLLPFATLIAQRPEPTLEVQKRTTTIEYGAVPLGQHTLTELAVGATWRLGNNEASQWRTAMPILAGDTWLAPGGYRITLHRTAETLCAINADGSGRALGGGEDARVAGELKKAGKPAKKLNVDLVKNGALVAGNQPAKIVVQYGDNEWDGEVLVLGNKTVNVTGGKLVVFSVPAARLGSRDKPVPIAVLAKGKDGDQGSWNVLLGKSDVKLVPWMSAPEDSYGFGDIKGPDEKLQTTGTVAPVEPKPEKALEVLELRASSLQKGELALTVAFGQEVLELKVPEPKGKPGK